MCSSNSSLQLSLLAVDTESAYVQVHHSDLPQTGGVFVQLKKTGSDDKVDVSVQITSESKMLYCFEIHSVDLKLSQCSITVFGKKIGE